MIRDAASLPQGAGATTAGDLHTVYGSTQPRTHREIEIVETRPSAAVVAGAALAGAIAGAAIPFMLSGRGSSATRRESTTVEESVIVDRTPREIYDFWRDFTNLPQFMDNIESVTRINEVRSHWKIKAPAGTSVEFNSLVTEDIPGRLIAWKSEEGASVPNRGRVEFIETSSGGGTNVRTTISYDPPAGAFGRIVAKLFQREPGVQARQDLDRLKQLLER
ncbi:MAG: SRPBCC family protein [Allosphingosinicella sp.]